MAEILTAQEIYDTVLFKLREQKVRSFSCSPITGISCLYRGPNGTKCALGHLISDEEYVPDMEGGNAEGLEKKNFLPKRLRPHLPLISDLQGAHDHAMPMSANVSLELWEVEMERIANIYELIYTPPSIT